MTEKNPYRFGPTRGELWFWLVGQSIGGLGLMAVGAGLAAACRPARRWPRWWGWPGWSSAIWARRSVKRLIRREHP